LFGDPLSGGLSGATLLLGLGRQAGTSEAFDLAIRGTAGPRTTVAATASLLDGEAEIDIAARVQDLLPAYTRKRCLRRTRDQLDGLKFQGSNSSILLSG
jgi:hypothetical protein